MSNKCVPSDVEIEVTATEPVVEEVVVTEETPVVEEVVVDEIVATEEVETEVVEEGKKAKKCKKAKKEKACKKEKKAKKEKPCKKEKPKKEKKVKECKCKCKKEKKACNCFYSVFSLLLTIATVALVFILPAYVIGKGNKLVEGVSLLDGALGVLKLSDVTVASSGVVALVYSAFLLTVPVALLTSVGLTFACFVSNKNAKYYVRANAIVNLIVFFFVSMISMCAYRYLTNKPNAIELASLIIAGVNGVAYIAINVKDYKKAAFLPTVLCGLSFANVLYYLYATVYMNKKLTIAIMGRSLLHTAMYLGIIAFVALIFFYSLVRMSKSKTTAVDFLVYVANAIFTVGVMFFGFCLITGMRPYALSLIASLVIAVVQIIICAVSINYGKLLAKVQAQAPVVEEVVAEPVVEEVVVEEIVEEPVVEEVVAEPVEEVLEAEAVEEVVEEELPEANFVEEEVQPVEEMPTMPRFASSYMRAKETPAPAATPAVSAYDWFIESLNPEEKNEFVELFIFKYIGGTANLPEYVPGGDNYQFFRSFFVNLGKYRNRISDTLIEKMYQFMIKKY